MRKRSILPMGERVGHALRAWAAPLLIFFSFIWSSLPNAQAHPHGQIACSAKISFQNSRPTLIALQLVIDEGNSERILAQQVLDPKTGEPLGPRGTMLKNLITKGFREQDWLLSLRPSPSTEGSDASVLLPAIPMLEKTAVKVAKASHGKLQLDIELAPDWSGVSNPANLLGEAYVLTCQDPSWFWVASFSSEQALELKSPACTSKALRDELKMPDANSSLQLRFRIACANPAN